MLIAHRGGVGGTDLPENSLAAFRRAMQMPHVDGIEFDVRTHRGKLVVIHDAVSDADELARHVPTLREVFELALELEYAGLLNVELKEWSVVVVPQQFEALWSVLQLQHQGRFSVMVTSFLHPVVARVASSSKPKSKPKLSDGATFSVGYLSSSFPLNWQQYAFSDDHLWVVHHESLPEVLYSVVGTAGKVFVYTVNDAAAVTRYRQAGLHVISDYI